ncbi:uncharacterized protein LOC118450919 isoform X2 [Vespa mandarinia]|uniref:uncharacterized protein LOC118450919 isoform X2 n=1 Tax=Vespa mandarinia TaxID=7446 RepID=UPI00160CA9C8|nr:uncharacterized protein LOC118450919 isoform X2 [Vespa mandarinia]
MLFRKKSVRCFLNFGVTSLIVQTDVTSIREVIQRVRCGDIRNTAEFVFNIMHRVKDGGGGTVLREIFEKNLQYFREIVEDTIDRRIQDEVDVMIHAQNDIKEKFQTLSETIARRITKIKKRLYEISPDFDWLTDGKDRKKLSIRVARLRNSPVQGKNSFTKFSYEDNGWRKSCRVYRKKTPSLEFIWRNFGVWRRKERHMNYTCRGSCKRREKISTKN